MLLGCRIIGYICRYRRSYGYGKRTYGRIGSTRRWKARRKRYAKSRYRRRSYSYSKGTRYQPTPRVRFERAMDAPLQSSKKKVSEMSWSEKVADFGKFGAKLVSVVHPGVGIAAYTVAEIGDRMLHGGKVTFNDFGDFGSAVSSLVDH